MTEEEPTIFTNTRVDITELPQADQLEMIPLEPAYKWVRMLSAALFAAAMTGGAWLFVLVQPELTPYSTVVAVLVTTLSGWMIFYNGLSFHFMSYALREKDLSFRSGWLWKSMTTVPFNRVQHCDIKQGLLDRKFGLAKLTIYTAGGQSSDLMIPGLLPDTAEKLKAFILGTTEQAVEQE